MRPALPWLTLDVFTALLPKGWSTTERPVHKVRRLLRTRFRVLFTALGMLLALGAPLGAFVLRLLDGHTLSRDLNDHLFFYVYMLVGTEIIFGAGGYVAGARADQLALERDRFLSLSEHDDLTGLFNSRAFWERYRRAVDRSTRFSAPLSLLMIDIDHLKEINDQGGHRFGNMALTHVSQAITRAKRVDDVAARWGGDEFVVLMPGATMDAAIRLAEATLASVRERPVSSSRDERAITVTIGVASRRPDEPADRLFDRADQALYQAKHAGGNRYITSSPA